MRTPANERPTAQQLAKGAEPAMQIAGRPADLCPYCGCAMFANGTRPTDKVIFRYVACRNKSCGKSFLSKQAQATLVREIEHDGDGAIGLYGG